MDITCYVNIQTSCKYVLMCNVNKQHLWNIFKDVEGYWIIQIFEITGISFGLPNI